MSIRELIEAVERGDGHYMCRVSNYAAIFPDIDVADDARRAYTGDMNAALALMQAVLPGWEWGITLNAENNRPAAFASEWDALRVGGSGFEAVSDTPARALLLAILRAKEGETP